MDFSVIKEKSNIKNKSINENNMNKKMIKNNSETITNKINNNIYINTYEKSESQTEKIIDEKSSIKTIKNNDSNKTNKAKSKINSISNSENRIKKNIFEENKDNITNNGEVIKYDISSDEDFKDNVNIYANNNESYNNETAKKVIKTIYIKKKKVICSIIILKIIIIQRI
jgi:hypothetical protein